MPPLAMASRLVFGCCYLSILVAFVDASIVRGSPFLNSTTTVYGGEAPGSTFTPVTSTSLETTRPKVHVESSVAITALEPEETPSVKQTVFSSTTVAEADVGSIIGSVLDIPIGTYSRGFFTVHVESTASGWADTGEPTSTADDSVYLTVTATTPTGETIPSDDGNGADSPTSDSPDRIHIESSADGLTAPAPVTASGQHRSAEPPITSPPPHPLPAGIFSRTLELSPITSVQVGGITLYPGGQTATIENGQSVTLIHVNGLGEPVVVVGSATSIYHQHITVGDQPITPIPSGLIVVGQTLTRGGSAAVWGSGPALTAVSIDEAGRTIAAADGTTSTFQAPATLPFAIGDITASAVANNYQYAIDSSALTMGQPITVDGSVLALTTDSVGATVLVADGSSTTLMPAATIATTAAPLSISSTIVSGTVQYIIGSQTLAPGHPITVDGTVLSLTTSGSATIVAFGDMTTTFVGPTPTTLRTGTGGSLSDVAGATPGTFDASPPSPSSTGAKSGAECASKRRSVWIVALMVVLTAMAGCG